jgi:hypothetical protein
VSIGALRATMLPWEPRFRGSNPVEASGFFQDVKVVSTIPPGQTLSYGSQA